MRRCQVSVQQVLSKLPQVSTPTRHKPLISTAGIAGGCLATTRTEPVAVAADEFGSERVAPILGYAIGRLQGIYC